MFTRSMVIFTSTSIFRYGIGERRCESLSLGCMPGFSGGHRAEHCTSQASSTLFHLPWGINGHRDRSCARGHRSCYFLARGRRRRHRPYPREFKLSSHIFERAPLCHHMHAIHDNSKASIFSTLTIHCAKLAQLL